MFRMIFTANRDNSLCSLNGFYNGTESAPGKARTLFFFNHVH